MEGLRLALSKEKKSSAPMPQRRPVYVWQFPVRMFHWINAAAVTVLFLTGLYIGNPVFITAGEAFQQFLMGSVRYWHGIAAFIFTANLLFRLYWFWAGNAYAKIRFWQKAFWQDLKSTVRYYLFMRGEHQGHLGHNALAQLSYLLFIWIGSFFMIITGFAMRIGTNPDGISGKLFSWVIPAFHNENLVRMSHHLVAWGYVVFLLIHLYLVFRQDLLDDDATTSSMINGYKYELPSTIGAEEVHTPEYVVLQKGD
nr:Ni/Fe-hydrogenase, b-type cytochrome subunit [Dehalobacter restrictus]